MESRAARGSSEAPPAAHRRTCRGVPLSTGRPPAGATKARAHSCIRKTLFRVGLPADLGPGGDERLAGAVAVVAGVAGGGLGESPGAALRNSRERRSATAEP